MCGNVFSQFPEPLRTSREDIFRIEPPSVTPSHKRGMTRVRIRIKGIKVRDQMCAEDEMDIADQLKEIGFLFAEDRLIAILKQMARSLMTFVE